MEWRIGCSGYHYPEWSRVFYPEELSSGLWLAHYANHFNTVELNLTYYRRPRTQVLQRLYDQTPADFLFSAKAPRQIMRARRCAEAQRLTAEFTECLEENLGDKLGALLFQFPADFEYTRDRLMRLTELLAGSGKNVVEFRHPSWWAADVFRALQQAGVSFASMSHPDLPAAVVHTTDTLYYRLQGIPFLYDSPYSPAALEQLTHEIAGRQGLRRAFVYFNNPAEGNAVMNARQFQEISAYVQMGN